VLEVWSVNKAAAAEAGADGLDALQGLAPTWQPPAGAKKPNKKQIAAIARLRGLVLLGRAAAAVSTPGEVLEVRSRSVLQLHGAAVAEWQDAGWQLQRLSELGHQLSGIQRIEVLERFVVPISTSLFRAIDVACRGPPPHMVCNNTG
jgi:hypothetical protein